MRCENEDVRHRPPAPVVIYGFTVLLVATCAAGFWRNRTYVAIALSLLRLLRRRWHLIMADRTLFCVEINYRYLFGVAVSRLRFSRCLIVFLLCISDTALEINSPRTIERLVSIGLLSLLIS